MNELDLYKFITDHDVEWHTFDDGDGEDVIMLPNFYQVDVFTRLLSSTHFDDGGIECRLMQGYVGIHMRQICEYYDIDMKRVFTKEVN